MEEPLLHLNRGYFENSIDSLSIQSPSHQSQYISKASSFRQQPELIAIPVIVLKLLKWCWGLWGLAQAQTPAPILGMISLTYALICILFGLPNYLSTGNVSFLSSPFGISPSSDYC